MLVYRAADERIDGPRALLTLLRQADALPLLPSHDAVTSMLIEVAELESAIADESFAHADGLSPLTESFRHATLAAARLFAASWDRQSSDREAKASRYLHVDALRDALRRIDERSIPRQVARRVSEGYAYYALHPETYLAAADRFVATVRPHAVVCLGIRSIGTSLSAVVSAAIEAHGIPARTFTVRPRAHPFARELRLTSELELVLRQHAATAHYLVVDEGPGLSGSSFAAVAAMLAGLGISDDRIALFPSWNADGSTFRSGSAARQWARHSRWTVSAEAARTGVEAVAPRDDSIDWSGGAWRQHLLAGTSEWPAVHPQHERIKRLLPGDGTIVRFAGLGRYGEARLLRAEVLSAGGFGPAPGALRSGYLALPFLEGRPLAAGNLDAGILSTIARYLSFVARHFPARRGAPIEALHEMAAVNCSEADSSLVVPPLPTFGASLESAPACGIDGRMLMHEFISTPGSSVNKTDALDHAADHFFPGAQDIAWDLAAVEAEFDLDTATFSDLLAAVARAAGDADVSARLGFYRIAYAASQLGYAAMAAESLQDPQERQRFEARRTRFLARARALLAG
jgi:hypothetical protein